ncbi:MAG TPA: hypothetical protein VFL91_00780, partial [Thermomicrobiales bacterium]|nr:hypothetical protein [Thermomicrobiales bacterium]
LGLRRLPLAQDLDDLLLAEASLHAAPPSRRAYQTHIPHGLVAGEQVSGADGNAQASPAATYYSSGTWQETGEHTASFFSGTAYSYGNVFTCP